MWNRDCGFVPIIGAAGKVLGVITDRDVYMASATRRLLPEQMTASQVMIQPVHTCRPDDTLEHALATMKQLRVRRLPVVSDDGQLRGVLSLHDVVDASEHRHGGDRRPTSGAGCGSLDDPRVAGTRPSGGAAPDTAGSNARPTATRSGRTTPSAVRSSAPLSACSDTSRSSYRRWLDSPWRGGAVLSRQHRSPRRVGATCSVHAS